MSLQQDIEIRLVEGRPMVSSLKVAEHFGKPHKDVLKAIRSLEIPEDFRERNFSPSEYELETSIGQVRKYPMYLMTRDGFVLLAMGFTGKRAMEWKIKYIEAFNKMEKALKLIAEEKAKEVEGKPSKVEAKQVEQKETPEFEHKEVISSLDVATALNMQHHTLLTKIKRLQNTPNFSKNFLPSFYVVSGSSKKCPMFWITKEGIALIKSHSLGVGRIRILQKILDSFEKDKTRELPSSAEKETIVPEITILSKEVHRKVNELRETVRSLNSAVKEYCWHYHKYLPFNSVSVTLRHFWEVQDEILESLGRNINAIDAMSSTILYFAKEMPQDLS